MYHHVGGKVHSQNQNLKLCFFRFCLVLPMIIGGISVLHHVNLRYQACKQSQEINKWTGIRGYLVCSSMEEQLRFNLDNFWEESSYREGNLTNLSLHHPLNILSALMCGCSLVFNIFRCEASLLVGVSVRPYVRTSHQVLKSYII